jgi:hypothetical protein
MEAHIAVNTSEGTLTIKASGFPNVVIKKNSEYLFSTPQEFFAFRPNLHTLVSAKLMVIKSITEKQAAKVATEAIEKRRDSVKNDHITASPAEQAFEARKLEVKETPTAALASDENALNAEIASLKEEFKSSKDKARKDEIRAKVKELQAKL